MFSGLTNQMSSLLSTVKGGGSTDQEGVADAPLDATAAAAATASELAEAGGAPALTLEDETVAVPLEGVEEGDKKQR